MGQDNTTDRKTGSPTLTIASGTALFSEAQTGNIGVGDRVTYNTTSIAYISGKISQTQWTLVTATGGTPSDVTNQTVNSIKREYPSLFAAEAGASDANHINNTSLVAADVVLTIPCYYDTGADTTAVTINDWTTDAAHYIKVYTPNNTTTEANNSQRHSGKWATNKYILSVTNESGPLAISDPHVKVDGIQFNLTWTLGWDGGAAIESGQPDVWISNSIIRQTGVATYGDGVFMTVSDGSSYIYNNIVYDFAELGIRSHSYNSGSGFVYNNTVINCGSGIVSGWDNRAIAKNNIVKGSGSSNAYVGTFASGTDYNATDGTDNIGQGTHNRTNQSFTFLDAPNFDFHLTSTDTGAKDAGTNLSADPDLPFSTDIDGQARTVNAWDIGADEWSPSGKYTMSIWLKPSTSIATKAIVGKAEELRLATNASGQPLCQIKSDGTWQTAATSSSAIAVDEWSQVICAYDRVAMRVYVNGLLKGEQALTVAPDDTNSIFEIGHDASSGSSYGSYAGLVDSYRFFAYAMTDSQVKTEYNFGKSVRFGSTGTEAATGAPTNAASGEYCVPGDTSPCAPPVGEWTFNEKVAGDGKTLYDTSGNGNNGTSNDGANNTGMDCSKSGKLGTACEFDGVDDKVTVNDSASLHLTNFTLSLWFKINRFPASGETILLMKRDNYGTMDWVLEYNSPYFPNRLGLMVGESQGNALFESLNYNPTTGEWHHISITKNGTNYQLFADGRYIGNDSTAVAWTDSDSLSIGGGPVGYLPLNGLIDQVRIYNYARTPAQIAWEYNKGKSAAQWSLNETTGTTAHNEVTNTLHGTCQNMEDADWVSGKSGNALDFDGSNEYVSIGDTNINLNAVSLWINADAASDEIIDLDGGTHSVTVSSGTIAANGFSSPTIYVDGEESAAIATGNWHHVLIKTDTRFEASNLNIARIGTGYLDGKLDDIRLYNYAPTAEQVRTLYNANSAAKL